LASTREKWAKPGRGFPWRAAGRRYFAVSDYFQARFGHRVHKISVDAGLTCPNADGTIARGGCVFCENRSFSPSRRFAPQRDITAQLEAGIRRVSQRYHCNHFVAFFQPGTNTYAPVHTLRSVFEEALAHPQVIGLAISTRPDCVPPDVLDLLTELAGRTYLTVEYGVQTIHNRSLDWMNRGHHYEAFVDAVQRSRGRGFHLCAHVILGLPGESRSDMLATARQLAQLNLDAVKIHNLYAVRDTVLAEQVERGKVRFMERDEFARVAVDFLEVLPPTMMIERIGGGAPPEFFIGPGWSQDRQAVRAAVEDEFSRRDTWQGKKYERLKTED